MSYVTRICPHCGNEFSVTYSAANRADKTGVPRYCGRVCSGLARRSSLNQEQKREAKAAYDRERRAVLGESLRAKKRAFYYANHETNLAKQANRRQQPGYKEKHLTYMAKPEYRKKKKDYDEERRASEYGVFADAHRVLMELEKEIRSQASAYERRVANGYYTRNAQKRRRELCQIRMNSRLST